ncbi:flagellar hook-associated protein 3 FlgL [Paenibacillus tianmuensis]|uniref:Flagellar hook-associated protein 3 FlgL n=1 Tax=Paenibacillus tianmuensis TaxID=624147 RepID=A0A1G4RPA1_9BACL|nr:flagellar hook-associated protein FlgL [Paenibacillus tianmuensis]SCW58547.1 flagellar hook-associated protein 3 FlgL [Paenibacillus tianmuensis]
MPLRVTQNMMHSQVLGNITNNLRRMSNNQDMLSTGRKINQPSDDPVGITYALRYRSELSMNEQYQKNVDMAKSFLDHTDTVMGQIGELLQRAKELTTQGVNGTNPQSALNAIAQEMGQIYEQAVMLGNDKMNGKYIFNGQFTDKQPYSLASAASDQTDIQNINFQFGAGITLPINITGEQAFGSPNDGDNMFAVLKGLQNAFSSGNQAQARVFMDKLDTRFTKFLDMRAEVGARANRVDLIDNRLEDLTQNLTALDSKVEDADMPKTIIALKQDENIYQASLSVGAKIVQPSLLDYLR